MSRRFLLLLVWIMLPPPVFCQSEPRSQPVEHSEVVAAPFILTISGGKADGQVYLRFSAGVMKQLEGSQKPPAAPSRPRAHLDPGQAIGGVILACSLALSGFCLLKGRKASGKVGLFLTGGLLIVFSGCLWNEQDEVVMPPPQASSLLVQADGSLKGETWLERSSRAAGLQLEMDRETLRRLVEHASSAPPTVSPTHGG